MLMSRVAITPSEVAFNRGLQFVMAAVVGVVQGELLQCRKMAFDAVEPRGICRRPVERDVVRCGISKHLGLVMKVALSSTMCRVSRRGYCRRSHLRNARNVSPFLCEANVPTSVSRSRS